MSVFGWRADNAGCGYYRISQPLDCLSALGYRTWHHTRMPENYGTYAVVIGQRVTLPKPTERWQNLARAGRHRLIYELDDDLLNVDHGSRAAFEFFGRPEIRDNLRRNIEVADAVTVSTEPLAERMRLYNPNVHIVPNHTPAWLLDHTAPQRQDGIVTIGWGGSGTHHMDFAEVGSHLRRVLDRQPNTEFHVIGSDYAAWIRLPRNRCRFTPWIENVEAFYRAIDYHIAVAPLRPHLFNQANSDVKFREVAALGIPMVASDCGPYARSIQHGVTGFLVKRDHEWGVFLRKLIEDEALRKEMGTAAREWARTQTIESNIAIWEAVLCAA
ncbi:glycosyltransferase family 4 protein [Streptomyces sp. NBC_01190]|uniref:glycosyltransferase family 4 protein n=1 Tax=Streptomyces sp. NBC_01190 TaxID=2903767 RepID=UPI00386B1953|nr:glycosyltransferase family 4 protein [Streptomyces sp. NBC_01190]